jgi:hypothetical protein
MNEAAINKDKDVNPERSELCAASKELPRTGGNSIIIVLIGFLGLHLQHRGNWLIPHRILP